MVLALFASYLESKDSMQMSKEKHIPIIAYRKLCPQNKTT